MPIFDIKVDLHGSRVMFEPEICSNAKGVGIRDMVSNWIRDFLHITTLFPRIDSMNLPANVS